MLETAQKNAPDINQHKTLPIPKILCVEDEGMIREDIVDELNDCGYRTIEAANGEEGLKAILEGKPDLVLCDVSMDGMSGFELLSKVRKDHPELDNLPFVFLSALAEHDDILTGRLMGGDDYLTKPIDYALLFVTLQERLEQVGRIETRKQKQFSELRENMLQIFPHELLTPLNHILGFCDLLEMSFANKGDQASQVEYVNAIKKGGTQLLELVNSVLTLVDVNLGSLVPEKSFCPPDEAIKEAVEEIAVDVKEKQLDLSVDITASLPPVLADKNLLKQVIAALLSNAVKFTTVKGRVGVKADYDKRNDLVVISIDNTGIGIQKDDTAFMLKAFVQSDSGYDRKFDGFGIGLTVANALTQAMGGTLDIKSEAEKLTTVTISFPAENNTSGRVLAGG